MEEDDDHIGETKGLSTTRKAKKQLVEKNRRDRINTSLDELRRLVLQALQKDESKYSKLEKADILEMTVHHLRSMQRHQLAAAAAQDPSVFLKYRAGYNECAKEVSRYITCVEGVKPDVQSQLLKHLGSEVDRVNTPLVNTSMPIKLQLPEATSVTSLPGNLVLPTATTGQAAQPLILSPHMQPTGHAQTHGHLVAAQATSVAGAFQLVPVMVPNGALAMFSQAAMQPQSSQSPTQGNLSSPDCNNNSVSVPDKMAVAPPLLLRSVPSAYLPPLPGRNELIIRPQVVDKNMWRPW